MQDMVVHATQVNKRTVEITKENRTVAPPVGLSVLVAGNYLWENRIVAQMIEGYFPNSNAFQANESEIMDALYQKDVYDLVILDEMLLCGDHWVEILHALKTKHPAAKVAVYGTRFFSRSTCLQAYPSLIDLNLPKDLAVEEIVHRLFNAFQ